MRIVLRLMKWAAVVLAELILLLGIIFLSLPAITKEAANHQINRFSGSEGHLSEVNIELRQGRLALGGFVLKKKGEKEGEPFVSIDKLAARIRRNHLLRGDVVGDVIIERPVVHVVAHAVEKEKEQMKERPKEKNIPQIIEELFPFKVDRLEVIEGAVSYKNNSVKPRSIFIIDQFYFLATNLTNSENLADGLIAKADHRSRIMKSGLLKVHAEFNPLQM